MAKRKKNAAIPARSADSGFCTRHFLKENLVGSWYLFYTCRQKNAVLGTAVVIFIAYFENQFFLFNMFIPFFSSLAYVVMSISICHINYNLFVY